MCKNFTHEQRAERTHADADGRATWQRAVAVCWTARVCTTLQSSSCTPLPQPARGQLSTGHPTDIRRFVENMRTSHSVPCKRGAIQHTHQAILFLKEVAARLWSEHGTSTSSVSQLQRRSLEHTKTSAEDVCRCADEAVLFMAT